jgi:hypothetical protein
LSLALLFQEFRALSLPGSCFQEWLAMLASSQASVRSESSRVLFPEPAWLFPE